jgi:hypothetical protein
MKQLYSLFFLTVVIGISAAPQSEASTTPTTAPLLIELHDQFDALQKLSFPSTKITLLTIADKKGSEQINGWINPLKQRFGKNIDIRGIADVSSVPRLLREMVRKKFQKVHTYPVMLDWSGDVVKSFTYLPGEANILALDKRGQIIKRISGKADEKSLQNLFAAIARALVNRSEKPSTP